MYSNFKRTLILVSLFIGGYTLIFGQHSEEEARNHVVYVQLKPNITFPFAFGENFLGEAYDLKPGFLGDARVFFKESYYLGIHGNFFKADVTDINLVGDYDRTNIWHNYLTGGFVLFPKGSKFGLDLGAGLGLAVYANRKGDVGFKEDGFSLMANINTNYRISKIVGAGCGIQFARDFLATEIAPALGRFFKNTNIHYLSAGLVFYINQ